MLETTGALARPLLDLNMGELTSWLKCTDRPFFFIFHHSGGKEFEFGKGREFSLAVVERRKCVAADFESGRNMPDIAGAR